MAKRSFFEELSELESTWNQVLRSGIEVSPYFDSRWLNGDVFCIASGGSLSIAKMWQNIHESFGLGIAKTITPFEYFHTNSKPDIVALFSASGNNHDILQVFRIALSKGCRVLVITISKNSKLLKLSKSNEPQSLSVFPNAKIPKDGFLAVNSVIGMSCALAQLFRKLFQSDLGISSPVEKALKDHLDAQICDYEFSNINTIQIVTSEWGTPAGFDLESRLAESGLSNCFLTDPRNFGHGRFIWIDKWRQTSLILLFSTPDSKKFIARFKKTIPADTNIMHFDSPFSGILGAIYCTVRSILFFGELAKQRDINPGKPQVSQWGRKLHKLYYTSDEKNKAIPEQSKSQHKYPAESASFAAVVFDFDGTLVDTKKRYEPIKPEIASEINRLLKEGLTIGIATGRGLSAFKELKKIVPKALQQKVLVGIYNGSILKRLSSENRLSDSFWPVKDLIMSLVKNKTPKGLTVSAKITNISIRDGSSEKREMFVQEIIAGLGQHVRFIKCQTSGHSIDISPNWASKLLVVQGLVGSLTEQVLCVGDQGQVKGNDEELLSWVPSICVGKVCPSSHLCLWIGKDPQYRESLGTLRVLKNIHKVGTEFRLKFV
jgi:HAD superfamily hydrolase (TIGR01484 family)